MQAFDLFNKCAVSFLPDVGIVVHVLWQLLNSLHENKRKKKRKNGKKKDKAKHVKRMNECFFFIIVINIIYQKNVVTLFGYYVSYWNKL